MGEFQEALAANLGKDAPNLSPSVVSSLTSEWQQEYSRWQRRDLSARLNDEVKRQADVVRTFPNEASIMRLIGAVLFEQSDVWQTSSRYMMVKAFARIDTEEIDPIPSITTKAA